MYKTIAIVALFALASVAVAIETSQIREATEAVKMLPANGMSTNPLTTFQGGCASCYGAYPICLWCANSGYGCFQPAAQTSSCCGCQQGGACFLCPSSSSCAIWNPYNPTFCPAPNVNNNATVYGTCRWQSKVTLQYQEKSVLRCHSIPTNINAVVNWSIRPNSDGEFTVWILDQRNFDLYISGQQFACLNQNCLAGGTAPKYGQFTNYGSPGYYIVTTKTNRNWSGTSSYLINAFVQ